MVPISSGAPRTSSATIRASAAFAGPSAARVRVQKAISGSRLNSQRNGNSSGPAWSAVWMSAKASCFGYDGNTKSRSRAFISGIVAGESDDRAAPRRTEANAVKGLAKLEAACAMTRRSRRRAPLRRLRSRKTNGAFWEA